jgi:hypothetical protein
VSEYQYYDFKAIDRALTKSEMAKLRAISTRAVITSTSFTNHYEWGDLKADPLKLLETYFDAFVYVANWGTRELCLRFPLKLIDSKLFTTMLPGRAAHMKRAGEYALVIFESEVEIDDWDDGTGWMGSLVSLRSDLLFGDLRCLYLGWLLAAEDEEISAETMEPPVPDGLNELSAPLESLIDFLGIDEDLIKVAAATSATLKAGPSNEEVAAWIRSLPENDKNDLLLSAMSQPGEQWKNSLLRRFQGHCMSTPGLGSPVQRRKAGDLLAAARARAEERERQLNARQAAEAEQKKAREEAERAKYLDDLAKREGAVWKQVAALVEERKPKDYDKAILLLTDLRDLAIRRGREFTFDASLARLRTAHSSKSSFLRRLTEARLAE